MLHLDVAPGETIIVGEGEGEVRATLVAKTGRKARLSIEADRSIPIRRVRNGEEINPGAGATAGDKDKNHG